MNKKQIILECKKAARALNKAGDTTDRYGYANTTTELYGMAERRKRAATLMEDGYPVKQALSIFGIIKI